MQPSDRAESLGPGPTYKPMTQTIMSQKPAYNIGGNSLQRPDLVSKTVIGSPSPNTYFSSTDCRPNSMAIARKRKFDSTPKNFGIEVVREKHPAWTFAKSSEQPTSACSNAFSVSTKPNAGSKTNKPAINSGKASSQGRFKDRSSAPGPGTYTIPSSIGVMAHYYRP